MKKILVVGNGGRESAICTALRKNPEVELYSFLSSKNPQIIELSKAYAIGDIYDAELISAFAKEFNVDLVYLSPDAVIAKGIGDSLLEQNFKIACPTRITSKIEWNKEFARSLMKEFNIPGLVEFEVCEDEEHIRNFISLHKEVAVKPLGLTGGKGVKVSGYHLKDEEQAISYALDLLEKDGKVLIEEKIQGEEFTLQVFTDGKTIKPMPVVQDHKRAYEGDIGPNTGGMGSYSMPDHLLPFLDQSHISTAISILQKTVDAIKQKTNQAYKGVLYGQFMLTKKGVKVIEFNARFGDPEATNVLSILESDLYSIFEAIADSNLDKQEVKFSNMATVCKYLVPKGYPGNSEIDKPININNINQSNNLKLYYASVYEKDGVIYTQKSRSIAVVGIGSTIEEAEQISESACEKIASNSPSVWFRKDIGTKELISKKIERMKEILSDS